MGIVMACAWLKANWKLVAMGVVVLCLIASHAWAYGAGVDAEENRIARERLSVFETSYAASLVEVREWLAEQREIDTRTQIIEREIIRHVPTDSACSFGPDFGRMLNDARGVTLPPAG